MATQQLSIILDLQNKASAKLDAFNKDLKGFDSSFRKMRNIGTGAFVAIAGAVGFAVKEFSKFEQAEVAFTSMLGSAEDAKDMIKDLADFSAKTPFQFEDIVSATRTLLAFGIESDDAKEKLKFLGDISAGAQVPLADMAQIFGKITTKGKAMTEEIMQLSERGIPIIDELAKQFDVTKEAIFEMASEGQLTADVVESALQRMTEKGGIFEDQMVKQSQTVAGQFSTMKDNLTLSMVAIGEMFADESVVIISAITKIANSFKEFAESGNPFIEIGIKVALVFSALLAIFGLVGLTTLMLSKYFIILGGIFGVTGTAALIMMAKIFLIVGVIVIIIASIWNLYKNWDLAVGAMRIVFATMANVIGSVFESVINFIIAGINTAIDAVNLLLRKLAKIPGAKKIGISELSNVDKLSLAEHDTGAMYNDLIETPRPQGGGNVVNITGNSFMGEEEMAENIGDTIIQKLQINTLI